MLLLPPPSTCCVTRLSVQFSSVQPLSCVPLFSTPWIAARQASLSITNSRSLLKLMSIESVMPSSHLILCRPFLLLPPTPPSIRVFSNESALRIRWPKYWSFSFSKALESSKQMKPLASSHVFFYTVNLLCQPSEVHFFVGKERNQVSLSRRHCRLIS